MVRLARHLPVNATELCISYLVCGRRFQSRDQAAAHMGMLQSCFFSKVWFKVSLPSVESVRFNALVCLPIEEDPWGDTLMNVHTTPLPLHLLWPWPFTKINCHVPITSVLCEPLFDYTWESSKTLHKVPSMLAACKSRTNKCSNFARCRQSGREHVDMFSNSIRCMDCMDHILGTQKKRCSIVHARAIRHKGFISLGLLATVHAWARDIECRRSF